MTEEDEVNETVTMPPMRPVDVAERNEAEPRSTETVFQIQSLTARYGSNIAVKDVSLEIPKNLITAVIGPSGCGKSTFIRCLNRMNDTVPSFRLDGQVLYHGVDLYGDVEPVEVRRRIGMVFQKPNPFPKTIYDNVAWAPRILGMKKGLDERVERALHGGRALGRGQGPPEEERALALRRPAAAALHRARDRDRAGGAAARRAGLGARPDRDAADRGADARAQGPVHDRDRHAQHAAGRSRRRPAPRSSASRSRTASATACSSSTTRPRRSSRPRPTSGPRIT